MFNWVTRPSIGIPIYQSLWKFIDFVFPPTCVGCGKFGEMICADCVDHIKIIESISGNGQLSQIQNSLDVNNFQNLDNLFSFAYYTPPISSAIKKLKYKRDIGISNLLAKFLVELYNKNKMDIDMVIPVPLNKNKIKERGFNQSYFLALPFSMTIQKPINKQSLRRFKDTPSQVGLNRQERFSNVSDAFRADPSLVQDKNILLIDDVATTGATMEACASALKSAGAKDIVGLTVARAIPTNYGFSDSEFDTNSA
jgi:ComF family protein